VSLPAVETPWMTAEQCAAYLQKSLKAFYSFIETNPKFPRGHVGRSLRFHKELVDAYVLDQLRLVRGRQSSSLHKRSVQESSHVA
jgi:predicted DNA-binding transcriptional regulator AlpA